MKTRTTVIAVMFGTMLLFAWLIRYQRDAYTSIESREAPTTISQVATSSVREIGPADAPAVGNAKNRGRTNPAPSIAVIATTTGTPVKWNSTTPAAKRATTLEVNDAFLNTPTAVEVGSTISLALFDGSNFTGTVTRIDSLPGGTVSIAANLPGQPNGRIFLSTTDNEIRALVQDPANNATYQVRYDQQSGEHIALEVDLAASDIRDCKVDLDLQPQSDATPEAHADETIPDPVNAAPATAQADAPDDVVTLNVLAIYTPAALAAEGSVAAIENNIATSIQLGNDVLANSNTHVQLNLVHTAEVYYNEVDPNTDLGRITYADGWADEIHTLRNQYQADFVVFYANTPWGGLGWTPDDFITPELSYCIVRIHQTDYTQTVIHEMGHNMGLGHSATQTSNPGPGDIYPYSAGWQWADSSSPTTGYSSVMTYENFDAQGANEYTRIPYFSSPDLTYNGKTTGNASTGNAARHIRNGSHDLSGHRGATAQPTGSIDSFPYHYSFEDGLGMFYQSDADQHNWSGTQTGTTLQSGTGPYGAQDGYYYALLQAYSDNGTAHYGQTGSIEARVDLRDQTGASLAFTYQMYDEHAYYNGGFMGSLYVEVSADGGATWNLHWGVTGNQGISWQLANIDLSLYDGYQITLRFRGVIGTNFTSDICIDNILISASGAATTAPASESGWISTQLTTAPNAADGVRTGAIHSTSYLYYYKGTDSNLWASYWTGTQWAQAQLTSDANVDDWLTYGTSYGLLAYKGLDGKLWAAYFDGTAWAAVSLGTLANVAGDIVMDAAWNFIYYRGTDDRIWAAYWTGTQWTQVSLGGSEKVVGSLAMDDLYHLIYFQGDNGEMWCCYWSGSEWAQVRLSEASNVGGAIAADTGGGLAYYRSSSDNSAWCVYWNGSTWVNVQLDATADIGTTSSITPMAQYEALYLNTSGQCTEEAWGGTAWGSNVLTDEESPTLTGGISYQSSTNLIFARRADGHLVALYYQ